MKNDEKGNDFPQKRLFAPLWILSAARVMRCSAQNTLKPWIWTPRLAFTVSEHWVQCGLPQTMCHWSLEWNTGTLSGGKSGSSSLRYKINFTFIPVQEETLFLLHQYNLSDHEFAIQMFFQLKLQPWIIVREGLLYFWRRVRFFFIIRQYSNSTEIKRKLLSF